MSTIRAAVCSGLNEPWKTEEIELDPPGTREVRVKMEWSGMCHSDEHLRTGDISAPPEVLELMGVKSMFPVVGGHEGSGIVTEVGPNVTQVTEGDHVAVRALQIPRNQLHPNKSGGTGQQHIAGAHRRASSVPNAHASRPRVSHGSINSST